MENKEYKIGDTIKSGRKEYEVIGIFEENGHEFFWARTKNSMGSYTYSNVFTYDDEGKLYKRN